ncbi:MAG: hypothetical protein ACKOUS_18635 [Alphaproteobacteria bacterium]
MAAEEPPAPIRQATSRAAGAPPAREGRVDLVALLAFALAASRQAQPTHEHRARAQSMLAEHAMRHFSTQVEVLRRDAVLEHVARRERERMGAGRLVAIGCCATLLALALARGAEAAVARRGWDVDTAAALLRAAAGRLWAGG